MSIPDLRLDNPLDLRQLPDEPLITKLPALGRPQPLGSLYTWVNAKSALVAVILVQCILTFLTGYAGGSTWPLSGWLALLFAGAIVARVRFQFPAYTWIVLLAAAPTLATNVSMAVHRFPQRGTASDHCMGRIDRVPAHGDGNPPLLLGGKWHHRQR